MLTLTAGACNRSSAQNEAPDDDARVCTVAMAMRPIATEVRETSGLARGRLNPDIFWTHNDSGNEPVLFALGQDGKIRTRIPVRNVTVTDWEDLEAAACDGQNCLYLADIGDNPGIRKDITIYEVLEPSLNDREARVKQSIRATYPDGAQDAEAFFRLPNGNMYIVTKGRHKSIKLYQLSLAGANGQTTLQLIRELLPRPQAESGRVTAATASPGGNWVAIRTYGSLYLYRTAELLGGGAPALTQSLTDLRERQGESIALDDDGTIWLTSEAERQEDEPTMISLRCVLPR
ncbi:MAG TPA: hypothetical protein VGC44_14190 [Longimicrobiales bacterium]